MKIGKIAVFHLALWGVLQAASGEVAEEEGELIVLEEEERAYEEIEQDFSWDEDFEP
jgi:hypothetical protein